MPSFHSSYLTVFLLVVDKNINARLSAVICTTWTAIMILSQDWAIYVRICKILGLDPTMMNYDNNEQILNYNQLSYMEV